MTPTDYAALVAELRDDPVSMGYAAAATLADLRTLLTAETRPDRVPKWQVRNLLSGTMELGRIQARAEQSPATVPPAEPDPADPPPDPNDEAIIRAKAVLSTLTNAPEEIDLLDPRVDPIITVMQADGLISSSTAAMLRAMPLNRRSRLAELGLPVPTDAELDRAGRESGRIV